MIAGGQGYVIHPRSRQLVSTFRGEIQVVLRDPERAQVVVGNDGMRSVRLDGSVLRGEGWSSDDTWHEFTVDLETGAATGGISPFMAL